MYDRLLGELKPLYDDMHAIDTDRGRTDSSLVFATQSTHKLLAGLSQAWVPLGS